MQRTQSRARYWTLTHRKREAMRLVTQGMMDKQIAAELCTSEATVKTQRGWVTRKMHPRSVADLVRMAEKLKGERQRTGE